MYKLNNPIPRAIKDEDRLSAFYLGYKLVPYVGTSQYTSHNFLRLLHDMYDLSPSHQACIDDLAFYCFGGNANVVRAPIPGIENEVNMASPDEAGFVQETLESVGLDIMDFPEHAEFLYRDYKKTGNAYLRFQVYTFGGVPTVRLDYLDPLDTMYLATSPGEPTTVIHSEDLFEGRFTKYPEVLNVYPFWGETADGNGVETVIHFKHRRDHATRYGRPDSLATLTAQLTEWEKFNHELKVAGSEVAQKALLAFKKKRTARNVPGVTTNMQDNEFQRMASRLRKKGTNRGQYEDVETIGVITYEEEAPKMFKLEIDRDWRHLQTSMDMVTSAIYHQGHRWSQMLNGHRKLASSIGGNSLIDQFKITNTAIVAPTQRRWERGFFSVLLKLVAEITGREELTNYSIRMEDKIEKLVQTLSAQTVGGTNGGEAPDPTTDSTTDNPQPDPSQVDTGEGETGDGE